MSLHVPGRKTFRVMVFGWIAVIILGTLLQMSPRGPKAICSQQHTPHSLSWDLCVHKLS